MQIDRLKQNIPLLLFILTILGYGLLLPYTGFYWDDWPFAWIAKFLGPGEFIPAFAPFRPFLGPIFFLTTSLIPPVPLYWQVFALVIRFTMGFATWWMFRNLWPDRPRIVLTIALFLLIFPGYSQHWVAFTHINQELIPFIVYLFSFGYTFKALRAERPVPYIAIALLLQICGIFPTEYFFGLEGMRVLFLFFFFSGAGSFLSRLQVTLKHWWPYLIVWILNALWLVYYYKFGQYNSYEVTAADNAAPFGLLLNILDTLWKACFFIWVQILFLISSSLTAPSSILTLGLIAISFIIITFYSHQLRGNNEGRNFAITLMFIGVIGILLGRIPSLAAELPLRLQTGYDRFMISMMIGASVFAVGLIEFLFRNIQTRVYVITILVALGVGQQFYNANIFRRDWEKQNEIYWQLSWRIPALKPNTTLLTHQLPTEYEPDLSFTAPINWMYAPDFTPPNLPYALIFTEKRIGGSTLPSLDPDSDISFPYRTVVFQGSTSQAVVIYMPVNGCLRVLDPARGDADIYSNLPNVLTDAIPLSNLEQIITNPGTAAIPSFLLSEPEHTWCYYFTKAELAFQTGELDKVIALETEAVVQGYEPEDPTEWLIFIEAHALTGDAETAQMLSEKMIVEDTRMRRGVCTVWKQIQAKATEGNADKISAVKSSLNCLD